MLHFLFVILLLTINNFDFISYRGPLPFTFFPLQPTSIQYKALNSSEYQICTCQINLILNLINISLFASTSAKITSDYTLLLVNFHLCTYMSMNHLGHVLSSPLMIYPDMCTAQAINVLFLYL